MRTSTKIIATTSLVLAAGIGLTALLFNPAQQTPTVISSGNALIGGDFELTRHDGERVTHEKFLGKHTLYYFGFTFCPDICPAELQLLSSALGEIDNAEDNFNLAFVTIDPERDTPKVMKEYVSHFWKGTVGLTGSVEDVRKMASAFRVYYSKVKDENTGTDSYLMDHSSIVYLMGPDGKFIKHFNYGTPAKDIEKALRDVTQG